MRVDRRSASMAALIAVVWGLCFVLIQTSLPSPAPLLLAGLRALVGGGVLAAWIALRGGAGRLRAGLPPPWLLARLALANAVLAFGAMYMAAGRAEAAVASILAGGQPVVLAAAGWLVFGEHASLRTVGGLALAMAGVVLVATTSSGTTSPEGVALALLATMAPAAGTVLMRRAGSSVDLLVTTSAQFLLGGAFLVAASALVEPWGAVSWSPTMLSALLILGVLGTGVAYVAWFWLLPRISLVRLGTTLFLVPVVGVLAAVITGDRPTPVELAGITAVLAGIGVVSVGSASTSSADGHATDGVIS
jgi:drug/metabolite transporter (DMT)-like permease